MLTDHMTPDDDTSMENAVYFYGDGEPQTPRRLLERLATCDRTLGLEPDNYSLGGTIARLEQQFADTLGKEAAIFCQRGRWQTISPSGPCAVASHGPWCRNRAICTMTPVIV